MHFVTGGAFNGKRKWVINHYQIGSVTLNYTWISAYEQENEQQFEGTDQFKNTTIIEGMELFIRNYSNNFEMTVMLDEWLKWEEKSADRKLVIIGTDVSKGIVPLQQENRNWRDDVGRFYQLLASKADKVDVIWYGIPTSLKGDL
ncbi:bifunctional adenosylcobinamide kinase/adenosylcobinamide-phosphate guanylyltransferase [Metabacillus arenae]|uniref:Bifunctional adenosylcobinamide kinase/adenosylcobinamide-phosphate guanylyltransferase n=1 Tax=Metabacillus arenae TaxID=2771434 RepID=A0A926N8N2_9BACI|nr:bifunctional adenosylcobinamide kinase/adenosylcobinamide-phosphate guanylyltransferase [Metabacillus arenae]MBD1378704.1 bifunctional adenosylcobinamide kinase/adenosylcobinamide-phosphate guanylyltransferase [Metabacillus arenae]